MDRRNILVLVCDQLRASFLNAYTPSAVPTPHIDALARDGVVFANAITASPVCAPARASILTGRHVCDHDAWTNNVPCREGLEFFPRRLQAAGYDTAVFGVLDHFPHDDMCGFRHCKLMEGGLLGEREEYMAFLRQRHPEVKRFFNGGNYEFAFAEEEFYDHWIASRAIEYIEQRAACPREPFLAYVGFLSPHAPLIPPKEVHGTVDPERLPRPMQRQGGMSPVTTYRGVLVTAKKPVEVQMRERTAYAELIVEVDRQVGRVVAALKAAGLYENTTILFTADHGDMLEDFGLTTKGPYPYRSSLFIPMILSNHPGLRRGARNDSLVGNIDVGATVLDIAGDHRAFGYSRSLVDAAQPVPKHPREVNYSEFCDAMKLVMDKRYTYCYFPFTGYADLYDREADPDELRNLAGDPAHAPVEMAFLKHIIEFVTLARGVRIEAHDMIPPLRAGLERKAPKFLDDFVIAYPIASEAERRRLREAGLSDDYNEFCRERKVFAHYGVYWESPAGAGGGAANPPAASPPAAAG